MPDTIFDSKDYPSLFGWVEYAIFALVVLASVGIGIFYGFFNKKNATSEDFLVGGRSMSILPVTLSLVCSFVSGVAQLGDPIEVYYYGMRYIFFLASIIPMIFAVAFLYVPVFCELKLTSAYQYLEMRFNRPVRLVASVIAITHLTLYMPLTIWAPSLALDQVAGINKYVSSAVIFLACIVYSSIGGLKAVLWSDALQSMVMFGSVVTILILGTNKVGGPSVVWERATQGGRTDFFSFDADPRTRYTFWTGLFGSIFTWLPLFCSQGQIQRYLSVPTIAKAQQCLFLSLIGLIAVQAPSFLLGLVIYAYFQNCDPVSVDAVGSSDQLLPLFVMDALGNIPTLPGLMVAGLTCGSLSSVSSALNALPAIILEDYVKPYYPELSSTRLGYLSKLISLVAGLISFSLIFVIANIGTIVPFSGLLHGTLLGPTVGIFTLGCFFPWTNPIGSILGAACSIAVALFLGIGSIINNINGHTPNQKLPVSKDGCYNNANKSGEFFLWDAVVGPPNLTSSTSVTLMMTKGSSDWKEESYSGIINVFSVSYIWHPAVAVIGTVILGLVFSIIVNLVIEPKRPVKAKLLSPLMVKLWRSTLSEKMFDYWIEMDEEKK